MSIPFSLPPPSGKHAFPTSSVDLVVLLSDDRSISALIDRLLDRANLTESALAERLGITRQTLHQYRMSRRKRPSVQWLVKLAAACGAKIVVELPSYPLKD